VQRQIRLLVVTHSGDVWGAQRRLLDLRPRLADLGVTCILACPRDSDLWSEWKQTGSELVEFEPRGALGLRADHGRRPSVHALAAQIRVIASDARRIVKLVRATDADAIQSHDLHANAEVALAGSWARRPSLLDLHDIVVPGLGRRVLTAEAVIASVTIANSRATAATVRFGRVEVVNPGVDLSRFFPGPAQPEIRASLAGRPDRPIVGILGRVDPEKGIDVLARAMAQLGGDVADAQLAVVGAPMVGGDEYGRTVSAEAIELLGDRVRFVGPTDDVPAVIRALDVMVNASRSEPFGRTVLEAQACGIPVIGTASGGIPEFVRDGVNGILVPPGDAAALANQLERLLGDASLRRQLGAQGRVAAEQISTDRQAALVADIIRSVSKS
jgi:glycosyltransferase involved in cell wall biosynthesis